MTTSSNIGVPSPPEDPVEYFYYQNRAKTIEEKIVVLEKQLQEFPFHAMEKEKRLMMLERRFRQLISATHQMASDSAGDKNKWKNAYSQVNDKPVDQGGGAGLTPLAGAVMAGRIQISRG